MPIFTTLIQTLSGALSGAPNIVAGVKWVGRQIDYVRHYKSNIENLPGRLEEVTGACKDRLQHSVDAAKRNGEEIEKDVLEWFERVEQITEDAKDLVNQLQQQSQNCLFGFCPNVKSRYQMSKKAKKEILEPAAAAVQEVERADKFKRVGYRIPVQSRLTPVEGFEGLESRKRTFDQVMKALSDPGTNKIGVYGLGGMGKSTLLKQVAVKAKEGKLFDQVVMVEVSDPPDVKDIQHTIADKLGLRFDELSPSGRADRLSERLKKENKILVILDNVLRRISFEDIGIPPAGDAHKGCKILMSSRYEDVLSRDMGTRKENNFLVNFMPKEEAWSLFQKMAGDEVLRDEPLRDIATEVAKRCGGIPLSIVTVASSLKNMSLEVWKDALKQLPVIGDEEILEDRKAELNNLVARLPHLGPQVSQMDLRVHLTLELCLKRLTNEAKSLFLLCAQCLQTHVPISHLVKYSIGLGLFNRVKTVEEATNRLHKLVSDLRGCCLLLEGGKDRFLQMHDTVRSFGVLFASKIHHVLNVNVEDEFEGWPSTDFLRRCTAITLRRDKIREVPEGLECPVLNFIHLRSDLEARSGDNSLKIWNNAFEGTKNLKVLDLTRIHLLSLLPALHFLENLQTLCLDQCVLGGIDGIGELKTLKVLSLLKSMIAQLPEEISQLTNLQLLDLTGCSELRVIPANVLSRLAKLEALYMRNSFVAWDNARLAELKGLRHLTTLEIHIPDANVLPRDFFSKNLERYKILIGDVWKWSEKYHTSRMLKLKLNTSIDSELYGIRALLKKTEDLHVDGLKGVRSVLYDLDREGFPRLKHLRVQESPDLRFIVDSKEKLPRTTIVFPILESLSVYKLIKLEKLIHGQLAAESLVKLRTIEVESCGSLRNMFSFYVAKHLSGQLEELEVTDCELMEEIVVGEDEASSSHADHIDRIVYTRLRSLTLGRLPRLSSFYSSIKTPPSVTQRRQTDFTSSMEISSEDEPTTPSTLFNEKVFFPNLEYLSLRGLINIERIWQNDRCGTLSCLTELVVTRCGRLKSLFSYSTVQSLVQLKTLQIGSCESLEEVIVTEEVGEERTVKKLLFPKLDRLDLRDLPKLARFCSCPENSVETFPSLRALIIERCHDLKTLVTESMCADMTSNKLEPDGTPHAHPIALFGEKVGLPSLELLRISGMNNLEKIWNNNNLLVEDSFCRLEKLRVSSCEMLLNIFPSNYMLFGRIERLQELRVWNCGSLEEVFEHQKMGYASSSNHYVTELRHLRLLTLSNLPNLKHVWKNHEDSVYRSTLSFPSLRGVEVSGCDKVETLFASGNLDFQNYNDQNREYHQIPTAQPLFLVDEVTFPKLERLTLVLNKKMKEIWRGPCWNLKVLRLEDFPEESAIFPSSFLQTLHNLEELVVSNASFEEIFPDEGLGGTAERRQGLVTKLRKLELSRLPKLMHLWKDDFQAGPIFQNLATLEVSECHLLECLVPSSISFHSLTTLKVSRCHGLKHLITLRTAKSLVRLARLSINECDTMREVITNEGGDTEDEICFSHLKDLRLRCLSSITTFCSGNYTFEFPNLEDVLASQCPKMRSFSSGVNNAPKLEKIRVEEDTNENGRGCWEGNLNATVQRLFTEQDGSRSLTL